MGVGLWFTTAVLLTMLLNVNCFQQYRYQSPTSYHHKLRWQSGEIQQNLPHLCLYQGQSALVIATSSVRHARTSRPLFASNEPENLEDVVEKSGLEVGLFKAMTSKQDGTSGNTVTPQALLKKYGVAYLTTSITLAIISYTLCYVLIDNGVNVSELLEKIGIEVSDTSSTAGTAAIAYAVHKAASPVRFPPTVALTPIMADWLGKKVDQEDEVEQSSE